MMIHSSKHSDDLVSVHVEHTLCSSQAHTPIKLVQPSKDHNVFDQRKQNTTNNQ